MNLLFQFLKKDSLFIFRNILKGFQYSFEYLLYTNKRQILSFINQGEGQNYLLIQL